MAGEAQIGTNLVDSLLGLADNLRGSLNSAFGVRQWRVYVVRRRWSGDERGDGSPSVVSSLLLDPDPEVLFEGTGAYAYEMQSLGKDTDGGALLREVSLTYTEGQLIGDPCERSEEHFFKLVDAHGQGHKPRFFVLSRPPIADRTKRLGWQLHLEHADIVQSDIS